MIVGEGPKTDAYFAAYSIYLFFVVFGTALRVTLVPLLGAVDDEDRWRRGAAGIIGRITGAAIPATALVVVLSPGLGRVIAPGLPSDAQVTAAASLAILVVASYCQIGAAALASALAAVRRFPASSVLYMAGTGLTVVLGTVLMALVGVLGASLGVLAGGVGLLAGHRAYLRRLGLQAPPRLGAVRERATWTLVAQAFAGSAVAFTLQIQLTIALATVSGRVGAVTAYTYGSFIATLLASVTIYVVGFVMLPGVLSTLETHGERAALGYLDFAIPVAFYLYVPVAAAYAAFGHPVVEAVLGTSLSAANIDLLWDTSRIFLLMSLAMAILIPAGAILLALRRYRVLVASAALIVALHTLGVLIASTRGPEAVAAVHAAMGAGLAIPICVLGFGRLAGPAVARGLVRSVPVVPLGLLFVALALLAPQPSLAAAVALSALGVAAYVAIGYVAWPSVGGHTIRLLLGRAQRGA